MRRLLSLLLCALLSVPSQSYALDSFSDEMTSTTGWTAQNSGATGTWTQVKEDLRSAFRIAATTSTHHGGFTRTLPVLGKVVVYTYSAKHTSLVSGANSGAMGVYFTQWGSSATTMLYLEFRYRADGLYVTGDNEATYTEVGADIVSLNQWDDWMVVLRVPTISGSTATADIYKNMVLVASGVDVSNINGTQAVGNVIFRQTASADSVTRTSFIDKLDVKSYGTFFFEDCTDISDWTDLDTGSGASTQTTFGGFPVFSFYSPTGSSTTLRRYATAQQLPKKFIVEFEAYFGSLGTMANNDRFAFAIYNSLTYSQAVYFASDGFFVYTGAYVEVGTNIVDQDAWTSWKIFYDTTNQSGNGTVKITIEKNGVRVATDVSAGSSGLSGLPNGQWQFAQASPTMNTQTYIRRVKITSEDGQVISSSDN